MNFRSALPFVLFILVAFVSQAQNVDRQLADQYYNNNEYDKALMYYEKLYDNTNDPFYFQRVVKCLLETEDYERAEKMMKKAVRKGWGGTDMQMDLGKLYRDTDEDKKAQKTWEDIIDNLEGNRNEIINIARDFARMGEFQLALDTYDKGKELIRGFYAFNYEIAEVYGQMGRHEEMIDLYLELIEVNPGYERSVRSVLNRNIDFQEDHELVDVLRRRLLKKVQSNTENQIFPEMLIWLYMQQNDFYGAFTQARALDKRNNEDGSRLMDLAKMARANSKYDVARDAYAAVAQKGTRNRHYYSAVQNRLSVEKEKLDQDPEPDQARYNALKDEYLKLTRDWPNSDLKAQTLIELTQIEAYKLNALSTAIDRLEKIMEFRGIRESTKARAKIAVGDYLLIAGKIWDASLYYMQAERAFKYDDLGDEAKYKAAKVYYYTGNFDYAQAQLDVLKGSTSKLISNDAIYLANLIRDNTTIDTSYVPMEMYAAADLYLAQTKYDSALQMLNALQNEFPGHSLEDDIEFMRYKIYMKKYEYENAAKALETIIKYHTQGILGDDAVYRLGRLHEETLNNETKAKELYEKILIDFPGSLHATDARKRFRRLRGDQIN